MHTVSRSTSIAAREARVRRAAVTQENAIVHKTRAQNYLHRGPYFVIDERKCLISPETGMALSDLEQRYGLPVCD